MIAAELLDIRDAELIVRTWLRASTVGTLVTQRVFFSVPDPATFPLIVLARVGGMPDHDLPQDRPAFQFDVWSKTGKREAATIANALAALCRASRMERITSGSTVTRIEEAQVTMGPLWRPDGDAGLARYVIDAQFTLTPEP
jgi:hypothetical protein